MTLKNPITFEEQVELLRSRGVIIDDKASCLNLLKSVNYYRLSAYLLPFKVNENTYNPDTRITRIGEIYNFDKDIRNLLFLTIERIEIYLRTQLAYYHAHKYGALGYKNPENFSEKHDHRTFLYKIEDCIKQNEKSQIVKHHKRKYDGQFPIWVVIEFFSLGMLSHFFSDLYSEDKKKIARDLFQTPYPFIDSWLRCLTDLRNICAHYSRIYYWKFVSIPKLSKNLQTSFSGYLFEQIIMLKLLMNNSGLWKKSFIVNLEAIIERYSESIELQHIGFPDNWSDLLDSNVKQLHGFVSPLKNELYE